MPIKDLTIYPPYWKQFSFYIRKERAGDKCEKCTVEEIEDDFYDDDDRWCGDCGNCEDCWDEQMQNCGMQADGCCLLAGSEYCDWDCQMRELDEEEFENVV